MRVHHRYGAMLLAGVLTAGLTACGTDDGSAVRVIDEGDGSASGSVSGSASGAANGSASDVSVVPTPDDGAQRVTVQGFRFEPVEVEVRAGATVTWTNEDDIRHTATSGTPEAPDGMFDLALDGKGAQASSTFTEPGEYAYFCRVHPSMRGALVVTG